MGKKTLVFGASLKSNRYSNLAIHRLVENGVETEAFGLREGKVAGVKIRRSLNEINTIHTVTLYMNPQRQQEYYEAIIALNPQRVLFNPGTENPEFYGLLREHQIVVEAACTLVLLSVGQY